MTPPMKILNGVVVSSGRMMKAVKVQTTHQVYDKFLRKHFKRHTNYLVSDPTEATRTGDVVRIASDGPVTKHIKHVVSEIVVPWGPPLSERPPVLSAEERKSMREEKTRAKQERRAERKERGEQGKKEGSMEARNVKSGSIAAEAETGAGKVTEGSPSAS